MVFVALAALFALVAVTYIVVQYQADVHRLRNRHLWKEE